MPPFFSNGPANKRRAGPSGSILNVAIAEFAICFNRYWQYFEFRQAKFRVQGLGGYVSASQARACGLRVRNPLATQHRGSVAELQAASLSLASASRYGPGMLVSGPPFKLADGCTAHWQPAPGQRSLRFFSSWLIKIYATRP